MIWLQRLSVIWPLVLRLSLHFGISLRGAEKSNPTEPLLVLVGWRNLGLLLRLLLRIVVLLATLAGFLILLAGFVPAACCWPGFFGSF